MAGYILLDLEITDPEGFVEYFLTQAMGIPTEYIGGMKQDPATWSAMTGKEDLRCPCLPYNQPLPL